MCKQQIGYIITSTFADIQYNNFSSIIISAERYQDSQRTLEFRSSQTQKLNLIIRTFASDIIDIAHKARSGMALWRDA